MAKRGDKKRKRAKRHRPRKAEVRWFEAGPLRMELHGRNILTRVDASHPDYEEFAQARDVAVAELPATIAEGRAELEKKLAGFDAFDVVGDLWLANVPKNRETYRESTEEGHAVVTEYAAALLLGRPARAGHEDGTWFAPETPGIQEQLESLIQLEQIRIATSTSSGDPVYDEIRARARAHHFAVRGVSYSWQEEETTRQLCGEGDLGDELAKLTGFSVDEAFRLAEGVTQIGLLRLETRIRHAHEFEDALVEVVERTRRGEKPEVPDYLREIVAELGKLGRKDAERQARRGAAGWASYGTGSTLAFTASDLAAHTSLSEAKSEAFLTLFATEFGIDVVPGADPMEVLRGRPVLSDGIGNHLCCSPHNLLWAIRTAFESAARDRGGSIWRRYEKHRRSTLEQRTVRALEAALRADFAVARAHYETREKGTVMRPELDGVVRLDSAVFLTESKSSAMRPSARRGATDALRDWLTREVGKGGMQLRRARHALFDLPSEERARLTDDHGTPLDVDLDGVEHVIELVVALEDLPNIAPVTWRMAEAGFLPREDPPIVISLHELEIICEISRRPSELVHYFLRRKRLNRQQCVAATDELDFFMHYIRDGLYWDDPSADAPDSEPARVNLLSFTDDLDAYLMYVKGERLTPAEKPERRLHRDLESALHLLDGLDQPGRLDAALALLDIDAKPRERVVGDMRRLKRLAARDGQTRDRSYMFGETLGITVMGVPLADADELPNKLQTYCMLKKHQTRMATWIGFGVFEGPPELFQGATVLTAPWAPDPDLDRLVSELPSSGYEGQRFDGRKHVFSPSTT